MLLNRRGFLTRAATIVGIASAGGVPFSSFSSTLDNCYDLIIVGAGCAGLSVAVFAREKGFSKILVIEKNPTPFLNSSSYSAGTINASGTKAQKEFGIMDDDKGNFYHEIMNSGHGTNDKELVGKLAWHSYEVVDWFMDHGVSFTLHPNSAFSIQRMHSNERSRGNRYVEVLYKRARELKINIQVNVQATSLVRDSLTGKIVGVRVRNNGINRNLFAAKGVVLATGGFCGDVDLIDKYIKGFAGCLTFSSPSSRGEGVRMAREVGAGVRFMDCAGVYAYGFAANHETRRGLIYRGHVMNLYGAITVGPDGKRFINDDANATDVSLRMSELGYKKVFQIATEKQLRNFLDRDPIQVIGWNRSRFVLEMKEQKRFIVKSDTISGLSAKFGVDAESLQTTINRYNEFVDKSRDEEFGRTYMNGNFVQGPFYGFICEPVVGISIGGLVVDDHLSVLDEGGNVIKGLYAVGEVVGGLHGTTYVGGNSLSAALTLGKCLGECLA